MTKRNVVQVHQGPCWDCNQRGIILADAKEVEGSTPPGVFIFKCPCPIGRRDLRNYPLWKDSYSDRYVRHALVDISDVAELPKFAPAPTPTYEPIQYQKPTSSAVDDDWLD